MGWRWGSHSPNVTGPTECKDELGFGEAGQGRAFLGGTSPMSSHPGSPAALLPPVTALSPPLHQSRAWRRPRGRRVAALGAMDPQLGRRGGGGGRGRPLLAGRAWKLQRPLLHPNPAAQRAVAFSTRAGGTVSQRAVPKPAAARGGGDHAPRGRGSARSWLGFSSPILPQRTSSPQGAPLAQIGPGPASPGLGLLQSVPPS